MGGKRGKTKKGTYKKRINRKRANRRRTNRKQTGGGVIDISFDGRKKDLPRKSNREMPESKEQDAITINIQQYTDDKMRGEISQIFNSFIPDTNDSDVKFKLLEGCVWNEAGGLLGRFIRVSTADKKLVFKNEDEETEIIFEIGKAIKFYYVYSKTSELKSITITFIDSAVSTTPSITDINSNLKDEQRKAVAPENKRTIQLNMWDYPISRKNSLLVKIGKILFGDKVKIEDNYASSTSRYVWDHNGERLGDRLYFKTLFEVKSELKSKYGATPQGTDLDYQDALHSYNPDQGEDELVLEFFLTNNPVSKRQFNFQKYYTHIFYYVEGSDQPLKMVKLNITKDENLSELSTSPIKGQLPDTDHQHGYVDRVPGGLENSYNYTTGYSSHTDPVQMKEDSHRPGSDERGFFGRQLEKAKEAAKKAANRLWSTKKKGVED